MGNKQQKEMKEDLGDIINTNYERVIPFRATLVNSYRLEKPTWIESNAYSATKATHLKTKRSLVLKKILISDETTDQVLNSLLIHRSLLHVNIRQVEEIFQTKTHYYMTLQYFEGYTFTEFLKENKSN